VSLLERLRQGHLSDATLARLWTDGLETGRSTHPHLDACATCRSRYDGFARWIEGVGETLRDEADAVLTPERLSTQQAQITRRIEALDRPARVLAFPKAARAVISGHSHVRRWVTVAAAACLIAGFGLGQVFPLRQALHTQTTLSQARLTIPQTKNRVEKLPAESTPVNDEELLSDAFSRSHVSTLSALDDMTPHARDIVLNRRNKQYK
jgi:hypothetical protein